MNVLYKLKQLQNCLINRVSYMHTLSPVEAIPGHFQREPGTMNLAM